MKIEVLSESLYSPERTFDVMKLRGKKVITSKGLVMGKVKKVIVGRKSFNIEGIIMGRKFSFKKIYIGESYFQSMSEKALILSIEPSFLLIGKKVLNNEGKVIGKVKEVMRKGDSNDFESLIVKSFWKKSFTVKSGEIKFLGKSIVLK
ncbi:PRC-barrel domain-containing protein [Candidatus Pacearchaeota archaeon]|nr:PRC-barrel domain-containing protein [Candidatus Pacearchaeota archaeon]